MRNTLELTILYGNHARNVCIYVRTISYNSYRSCLETHYMYLLHVFAAFKGRYRCQLRVKLSCFSARMHVQKKKCFGLCLPMS